MKLIKKLKKVLFKTKITEYPPEFAIVDYSESAINLGVRDDRNKIILRYSLNEYGNVIEEIYRYSNARVSALINIHKIPVYDKTLDQPIIPIHTKIRPGEMRFNVN